MKATLFAATLAVSLSLFSCSALQKYMIKQSDNPPLTVKPDVARLLIIRTSSSGESMNYLDGKAIGCTIGKSYFITDAVPGVHYLMGKAENLAVMRLSLEAGKIYVIQQTLRVGFWSDRTSFEILTPKELKHEILQEKCRFVVFDAQKAYPDLSEKDFQESKEDFEKEVKEDPSKYKSTLGYKGLSQLD